MAKIVKPKTTLLAIEAATHELTGIRKAAMSAGRRMVALEEQAETLHAKTLLSCTARIISTPESGLHALLTDACVTIEISGGAVVAAVASSASE
jgi:hypothetical protein